MAHESKKAMILAAGYGTRLKPFSDELPKPLVEVLGKPLLYYHLDALVASGFSEVVINSHHLSECISESVERYEGQIDIKVVFEPNILGTGGGLKNALSILGRDAKTVLLVQGDVFADVDLLEFLRFHEEKKGIATLLVKTVSDMMGYGAVGDVDDRVVKISNWVPYDGPQTRDRFFCGIHALDCSIYNYLRQDGDFSITKDIYPRLIEAGLPLFAHGYSSTFYDVGTPNRLWEVNMELLGRETKLHHHDPFSRFEASEKGIWLGRDVHLPSSVILRPPVVIDDRAEIGADSIIGPFAVIGKHARIGHAAKIQRSVALSHANVRECVSVDRMIVSSKNEEKIT